MRRTIGSTIEDPVSCCIYELLSLKELTLPGQNSHHFAQDIYKCILMNGKFWILNRILMKLVRKGPLDDN